MSILGISKDALCCIADNLRLKDINRLSSTCKLMYGSLKNHPKYKNLIMLNYEHLGVKHPSVFDKYESDYHYENHEINFKRILSQLMKIKYEVKVFSHSEKREMINGKPFDHEWYCIPEFIYLRENIEVIKVSDIASISNSIGSLQKLTTLHIEGPHFTEIPIGIRHLRELKVLDMKCGTLSDIRVLVAESLCFSEETIRDYSTKSLDALFKDGILKRVKGNKIEDKLPLNITELNLSYNEITEIYDILYKFPNAKIINLSDNKIEHFPENANGQIGDLEQLELSFNKLVNIPDSIYNFSKLTHLKLRGNKLESLSENIIKLECLRILTLDRNRLKELPNGIRELKKLEFLDLSHNLIEKLPEWHEHFGKDKYINLSFNKLICLPRWAKTCTRVGILCHNNFTKDLEGIYQLEICKLDISSCGLTDISSNITNMTILKELFLHDNKLEYIPESIFKLSNLRILSISHNKIKRIPRDIRLLKGLEVILAENNEISEVSHLINTLKLKKIDLSYNKLNSMSGIDSKNKPAFLFDILPKTLRTINLQYNQITRYRLIKDDYIKLNLSNNPLEG